MRENPHNTARQMPQLTESPKPYLGKPGPVQPREWQSDCTYRQDEGGVVDMKAPIWLLGTALAGVISVAQAPPPPIQPEEKRIISSLEGYDLYQAYCAVCHGSDAKGGGPMARALKVSPSDLTRIATHSGGRFPTQRVERIISGESEVDAGHGTREMPLWGPIFSQIAWDQDLGRVRIFNLAKYLEKLQTN
jgi:mono/diheme cytochrome c family protein